MGNWEDNVRKVVPYTPGEQPKNQNIIKLNTNENPYPPAPAVRQVLLDMAEGNDRLRKYPDPNMGQLVSAISRAYNVPEKQIFAGVGSDDVLAMAFMTFFNSNKPILFADVTYSFYDVWADLLRIPYKTVPLKEDFSQDIYGYFKECGGIVIANPNAPTGQLEDIAAIERIVASNSSVVVIVDEAYVDFGGESALPLIDKYDNLLVVRTFSKSRSLAGSRIGYAFGSEKLISYLNDVKFSFNSYTMDSVTLAIGEAALSDPEYFEKTRNAIITTREKTKESLAALGFSFGDSRTNFIFAKHETAAAKDIFEYLKSKGIYVRYFNKPRIDNYLRISIGTDEEMDVLIKELKNYLS